MKFNKISLLALLAVCCAHQSYAMMGALRNNIAKSIAVSARYLSSFGGTLGHSAKVKSIDETYEQKRQEIMTDFEQERATLIAQGPRESFAYWGRQIHLGLLDDLVRRLGGVLDELHKEYAELVRDPRFDSADVTKMRRIARTTMASRSGDIDSKKIRLLVANDFAELNTVIPGTGCMIDKSCVTSDSYGGKGAEVRKKLFPPNKDFVVALQPSCFSSKDVFKFVIRHELAHISQRHVLKGKQYYDLIVFLSKKSYITHMQAAQLNAAFWRSLEREADVVALIDVDGKLNKKMIAAAAHFFHPVRSVYNTLIDFYAPGVIDLGYSEERVAAYKHDKGVVWHPCDAERKKYVQEVANLADAKGFVSPVELRNFIFDCPDYKQAMSFFGAFKAQR